MFAKVSETYNRQTRHNNKSCLNIDIFLNALYSIYNIVRARTI
jgi:hypothetical protein